MLVKQPLALTAQPDNRSKEDVVAAARAKQASEEQASQQKKQAAQQELAKQFEAGAYVVWREGDSEVEIPQVLHIRISRHTTDAN